jgi:hypothetical protein
MTYHSLTPRQQRVWDAAYGAAFMINTNHLNECSHEQHWQSAAERARFTANLAANSIQPNETEPNECHT